ncbi:MAG: dephospho-CoA kinase [Nitrospiria bacterium]
MEPSNMGILKIGLTGGIASGKSTIARIFKDLGAELIDADLIAHQVIQKGNPAYRKIVKRFGKDCLKRNGEINRKILGKIIFENPDKRKILNDIVHPEVFKRKIEAERKIVKRNENAVIVFDIPLLIETGSYSTMDKVVLVYVKREKQIERLMKRNHLSREDSQKRIRAQSPFKLKKQYADYVIRGDEDLGKTRKNVKRILDKICAISSVNG